MPPRRRSKANEKLPPYVYLKRGRYVLTTYNPETRKQSDSRLCAGTATLAEVWQAYEARTAPKDADTFRWLSRQFQASTRFKELSDSTRRDYKGAHNRICAMKLTEGNLLGDIALSRWTRPLVQRFVDKRSETAPVTANRERAYIARVFSWGIARGHVKENPAKGIETVKEKPRTRYVTDAEYMAALELAAASGSPYLVPVMELTYLLCARLAEVLDLKRENCGKEGVLLIRRKGSKDSLFEWTPRLRAAVKAAKALHGGIAGPYLIQGADYGRMKESTVQTAWGRLKSKHGIDWRTHDLKAKGITDTKQNKLAASGHRDPRMLAVYDRLPSRVKATR